MSMRNYEDDAAFIEISNFEGDTCKNTGMGCNSEFLKTLLETIPNPIYYKDVSGKFIGCNKAFEDFICKKKEEVIGKTTFDIWPEQIAEKHESVDKYLLRNPGNQAHEWQISLSDECEKGVKFHKATFTDSSGEVAGIIGSIKDATIENINALVHSDGSSPIYREKQQGQVSILKGYDPVQSVNRDVARYETVEKALYESEVHLKEKLSIIQEQDDDIGEPELANIIDCETLQLLMDDFFRLTCIPVGIVDLRGRVLVASGWQDICTKFHRINSGTLEHCVESDLKLTQGVAAGTFRSYRCKNNMWDVVTPIVVDGSHLGNLFLGQFFFDDEDISHDTFRLQAKKYGFNEKEYLKALDKVPRWSREHVNSVMEFYTRLTDIISTLSYSNIQLSSALEERENLLTSLHESESRFRSYVEQAPDGVFIADEKGNCVNANEAASKITGYSKEELLGMNLADIVSPDARESALSHFQTVVETGNDTGDFRFLTREGKKIICTIKAVKLSETRFLGFVQDITNRKQAEAELADREQKFRALYDNAPLPYQSLDENGCFIDVNPRWLEIFGYETEEIAGRYFAEFLHPEWIDHFEKIFSEFRQKGSVENVQLNVRHKKGYHIFTSFEGSVSYHQDGTFKQTYCVLKDITEQVESEEKMLMLAGLLKTSPASVIVHDFEGNVLYANQRTYRLHGYLPDEIDDFNMELLVDPETIPKVPGILQELAEKGKASFEVWHLKKDGTTFPLQVSSKVIPWQGKNVVLSIALDMTDKKRIENELQVASERLHLAARAGGVGVWDYDIVNSKLTFDEQMIDLYKINPDEFDNTYESWTALIHPDDRLANEKAIKLALHEDKEFDTEFRVVWPDGTVRNIRVLAIVLRDDSGTPVRMIGTNWDITSQKKMVEELQASEEKFRLLITQMQQGLAVHEVISDDTGVVVDYRFLDVNDNFEKLTGLRKENILGKTALEVLPNTEAYLIEKYGHVALTGEPLYIEDYLCELDGYYGTVAYQTIPGQFATIITDITENKKSEDALRVIAETSSSREEDLFDVLVRQLALSQNLSCVIIARLDPEKPNMVHTLAVWRDGKLRDNFRYSLEGTPCYNVLNDGVCFYPSDIRKHFPDDRLLKEIGAESYWGIPLRDSKGKTLGLLTVINSRLMEKSSHVFSLISSFAARASAEMERQLAEKELKNSERMFKTLFNQAAVGVAQISPDGYFLRINERFGEIVGYAIDELIATNSRNLIHPDDLYVNDKYILQVMAEDIDSFEIEKRYIHKNGHLVWVKLYSKAIRDEDGSLLYAIVVITDITDKRKAEEALIYAKAIADESNRIKSEMLKNVTHELRTPLSAVIGFSDLLLSETGNEFDDLQRKYLEYIHQSGEHLLSIVNRMLDFANLEYRTSESLELQSVNINNVIHETISIFLAKASKKNIQIKAIVDHNLNTIVADKGKLENILYNLVENAIKFTDSGGNVTVKVNGSNDDIVLFSILDTGIGMAKEKLDTIFEPFIQIDGSISRKYGGTGLGLALVKKFVEMHGGHIWVESEPGAGSNFIFDIPVPQTMQ
ncbi:PAS domain S-box protein [Methanolobus sp. ZRKC2]|uniref:PAS domain S-box protein n=1 Tax=Methanolobus sp. ZRKC2 TaxID=3125783 RepID=UPI00325507B4